MMKTVNSRITTYFIFIIIQTFIYQSVGILNSNLFQPAHYYQPVLSIDQMIPFLPETIWTYSLYYLILVFGFLMAFDEEVFPRFFKSLISVSLVADLLFVLIPVSIQTPSIDPLLHDEWTVGFFNFLIPLDIRGNCFPSLHCAHSLIITSWFMKSQRYRGWLAELFMFATILVMISTLTLKKHWFIDVVGAVVVSVIVLKFEWRRKKKEEFEAESV